MAGQHRLAAVGKPVQRIEYSRTDGKKPPFIRSACTRSISTASAAGSSASKSWETVTGQPSTPTGKQRRRRHQHHLGAQRVQQHDVGAGDPAVQDVADDHDAPALDAAEPLPDGQRVQQRLRRVLVRCRRRR